MKRDTRLYLDDMIDAIDMISTHAKGITLDQFSHDELLQSAVLRWITIIGEAAKHIPKSVRDKHPDIPWKQIAGARDILVHEYFAVQLRRAWQILEDDLPVLKANLEVIRNNLK